jgi:hypothetical protein
MEDTTKIVVPQVAELAKEFMSKIRYSFDTEVAGRFVRYEGDSNERVEYYTRLNIIDPAAPEMKPVGAITWVSDNKSDRFRIVTRHLLNNRFKDRERKYSVETADPKRALREMLRHFSPYTMHELGAHHMSSGKDTIDRWRSESSLDVSSSLRVSNSIMVQEMKNLLVQGVRFTTAEFQYIADRTVAAYDEMARRAKVKVGMHMVKFMPDDSIKTLTYGDNGAGTPEVNRYLSFAQMPERLQQGVGMLRMLQDGARIDGFGTRISDTTFWVLERDDEIV